MGWTLLISAILLKTYVLPNNLIIDIAGQIHGTLFLIYIVASIVLSASLGWNKKQTLIATIASIPPYGTLLWEKILACKRQQKINNSQRKIVVRALILNNDQLLAIEYKDRDFWCLPGGPIGKHQSPEEALSQFLLHQTTIKPIITKLAFIFQYQENKQQKMELIYLIGNTKDYQDLFQKKFTSSCRDLENIKLLSLNRLENFKPSFLRERENIHQMQNNNQPIFINQNLS